MLTIYIFIKFMLNMLFMNFVCILTTILILSYYVCLVCLVCVYVCLYVFCDFIVMTVLSYLGDGSDADNLLLEKEREEDKGCEEAYQWLFDAVSGKQGGQGLKKKNDNDNDNLNSNSNEKL